MRTRYRTTMRLSRLRSLEPDWRCEPNEVDTTTYPVVACHPTGPGAWSSWISPSTRAQAALPGALAMAGVASMGGWMGGDMFGNTTAMDSIEAARLSLGGIPGVDNSKIHLIGVSQGAQTSIRYAGLNPSKVASWCGIIPLADINAVYNADRLGLRASIGSAWGVTYPTALPATASPATHAPAIVSAGIARRIYRSPSDAAVLPAEVDALASALGITPISVEGPQIPGHTEDTVRQAALYGGGDIWSHYISWIKGL